MKDNPKKLTLAMHPFQHKQLKAWLKKNGIDLSGDVTFALVASPVMSIRQIKVLLLTEQQFFKLDKAIKKILPEAVR